jgi:hypothetical protein
LVKVVSGGRCSVDCSFHPIIFPLTFPPLSFSSPLFLANLPILFTKSFYCFPDDFLGLQEVDPSELAEGAFEEMLENNLLLCTSIFLMVCLIHFG